MSNSFAQALEELNTCFETSSDPAADAALGDLLQKFIVTEIRSAPGPELPAGFLGLVTSNFKTQIFYSIKFSNLRRNPAAGAKAGVPIAAGAASGGFFGATMQGLGGVPLMEAMRTSGFLSWPAAAAAVALFFACYSLRETFKTTLSLDHAVALALAWRCADEQNGFQLVDIADLRANLDAAETEFGYRGFSIDKLKNAFQFLEAIGALKTVVKEQRWQLFEKIVRKDKK